MKTLELSPPVFSILSGLIEEKAGLHYGLSDREVLQIKVSDRAIEAGFDSLLDYYYFLRYDPAGAGELDSLVESLVVNETYFFREWPAIEIMIERFIVPWCTSGRRPRIWSAACSTGEEPLSLAMALQDRRLLDHVEIVASDISARVLARPIKGFYGKRSVRHIPTTKLAERYLSFEGEGYGVSPHLVKQITWKNINLQSDRDCAGLGTFDVILCRNVLIYFSEPTVRKVINRLSKSLVSDGAFLVGVSESLLRYGSGFIGEEYGGSFIYRKAPSV